MEIPPGMNVITAGAETASLCANRTVTHKGDSLTFGEFMERVRADTGNVFEDVKIRGVSLRELLHGSAPRMHDFTLTRGNQLLYYTTNI